MTGNENPVKKPILKNGNPNGTHNVKKESQGPNTKR